MERSIFSVVGFVENALIWLNAGLRLFIKGTEPVREIFHEAICFAYTLIYRIFMGHPYDLRPSLAFFVNRMLNEHRYFAQTGRYYSGRVGDRNAPLTALADGRMILTFREITNFLKDYNDRIWSTDSVIRANWFDLEAYSKTHRGCAWSVTKIQYQGEPAYQFVPKNGDWGQDFFISMGSKSRPETAGDMVDALNDLPCTFVDYVEENDFHHILNVVLPNGMTFCIEHYPASKGWSDQGWSMGLDCYNRRIYYYHWSEVRAHLIRCINGGENRIQHLYRWL